MAKAGIDIGEEGVWIEGVLFDMESLVQTVNAALPSKKKIKRGEGGG